MSTKWGHYQNDHDAKADRYSYGDPYFACSYFVSLASQTEFFFKYQLARREYKGKPTLYNQFRIDDRHSFTAVISQGFSKYFFASLAFGYIKNHSNLDLFDYDKKTYTFSIGCRF